MTQLSTDLSTSLAGQVRLFKKILIANRGEIACRVARTCKQLGIQTVAVYSDADADAQHVMACDEAIYIGAAPAKESYLCIDRIISAASASGAQAIHPGYGFLSENADFAQACFDAGIVFIGPPIDAIRAMGSKSAAKTLMEKSGIPLVPGYHGENQDADFLQQQADRIGYPVLLKASAGGGGKGMRIVNGGAEFKEALNACQREAKNSFGNAHVLLEKYLERPRHIEVQIFADQYGQCIYLFERDCSVQRRHQKVLEEAPAPGMSETQREAMGKAAVAAAVAVAYVGAGTVEFIVNQDGTFYFMEMNTRLQVEHPVTELITGQDLVAWQLHIAAGGALPLRQEQLSIYGHALEARIYAENPDKDFLPATGTLYYLHMPQIRWRVSDGRRDAHVSDVGENLAQGSDILSMREPYAVRIDSGVAQGDTISPFYDPMIAKLIVWGATRDQALIAMRRALSEFHVAGLSTNIAFLARLIDCPDFSQARLDTGLIARNHTILFPAPAPLTYSVLAGVVASVLTQERANFMSPLSPWGQADGWRSAEVYQRVLHFMYGTENIIATLSYQRGRLYLEALGRYTSLHWENTQTCYRLQVGEHIMTLNVFAQEDQFEVYVDNQHFILHYIDPLAHNKKSEQAQDTLISPMPGKIIAIHAQHGQTVTKGMPLLVMEAMKMEHTIAAPRNGVIDAIHYVTGEQVAEGVQLLSLVASDESC